MTETAVRFQHEPYWCNGFQMEVCFIGLCGTVPWANHRPSCTHEGRMTLGSRLLALLDERKQIGIDLVRMGCGHPVREAWIHLQRGALNELRGERS